MFYTHKHALTLCVEWCQREMKRKIEINMLTCQVIAFLCHIDLHMVDARTISNNEKDEFSLLLV